MTEIADSPMETEVDSYDVVLVTNDGAESTIRCGSGTTVLAAAGGPACAEVGMPGRWLRACSAVLTGGRVEMGDHDPDVIETPEEDGGIPVVPQLPREDCRIDLPYDRGQIVTAPATRHQARITGLDRVADAVMRLRLTLLDDAGGSSSADFENPVSSCGSGCPVAMPGGRTRRPTSPTGTVSWSSTSGCCRRGDVGVPKRHRRLGDELTVTAATGEFGLAERAAAALVHRRHRAVTAAVDAAPDGRWGDPQPGLAVLRRHPPHRGVRPGGTAGARRLAAGLPLRHRGLAPRRGVGGRHRAIW